MSKTKQLELSKTKMGRIQLHLMSLLKDHHMSFHFSGIKRELLLTKIKRFDTVSS